MKRRASFSIYRDRFPDDATAKAARDAKVEALKADASVTVLKVWDERAAWARMAHKNNRRVYLVMWEERARE